MKMTYLDKRNNGKEVSENNTNGREYNKYSKCPAVGVGVVVKHQFHALIHSNALHLYGVLE